MEPAEFFISDKLRGIPLVSANSYKNRAPSEASSITGSKSTTEQSRASISTTRPAPYALSRTIMEPLSTVPMKVMLTGGSHTQDKRNVEVVGREDENNERRSITQPAPNSLGDLLFKPNGITASISNIKSDDQRKRMTTVAPKKQKQSTTRRPQAQNRHQQQQQQQQQQRKNNFPATKPMRLTTTTRKPQTTTTTRRTPEIVRNTPNPIERTTSSPTTTTTTPKTTTSTSHRPSTSTSTSKPTRVKPEQLRMMSTTDSNGNLARGSWLQGITQPDFQRHIPAQTLSLSTRGGYTNNKLNNAGENWVLFNRPDGHFSLFEILTLISSCMILSTIVFVLLFNWFTSLKRKQQASPASQNKRPQIQPAGDNPSTPTSIISSPLKRTASGASSMLSKVSNICSGANSSTGQQQGPVELAGSKKDTPTGAITGQTTSDFKPTAAGGMMVNKAMAIVQPTENNHDHNSPKFSCLEKGLNKEELAEVAKKRLSPSKMLDDLGEEALNLANKPIGRSVSDLSGSNAQQHQKPVSARSKDDSVVVATELIGGTKEEKKATILEDLFKSDKKQPPPADISAAVASRVQTKPTGELSAASSLASIELPEQLVRSINPSKQTVEPPSPNLLLGQVEEVGVAGEVENKKDAPKVVESQLEPELQKDVREKQEILVEPTKGNNQEKLGTTGSKSSKTNSVQQQQQTPPSANTNSDKMKSKANNVDQLNSSKKPTKTDDHQPAQQVITSSPDQRPLNPMMRDNSVEQQSNRTTNKTVTVAKQSESNSNSNSSSSAQAKVKNHQVVVNKLDKRITKLEIVDLRDESVTGKMGAAGNEVSESHENSGWISMDGVAVVQAAPPGGNQHQPQSPTSAVKALQQQQQQQQQQSNQPGAIMSPSEIIESRFNVDYGGGKKKSSTSEEKGGLSKDDSTDSKSVEWLANNIESELEADNKMKNRKYFVYIVHDGHFTAKKECIARIELPQRRRITLAEVRQLIANSQDISLSSLRRNRFKFVTETYRLLNENEDAAVLHQVYPTQGVFLKLNIPEQENQTYPYTKSQRMGRLSSGGITSGAIPSSSSVAQATIASRRRATMRPGGRIEASTAGSHAPSSERTALPAIEVDEYAHEYGRTRASSVGRRTGLDGGPPSRRRGARPATTSNGGGPSGPGTAYPRSKSSVHARQQAQAKRSGNATTRLATNSNPNLGRSQSGLAARGIGGGGGLRGRSQQRPMQKYSETPTKSARSAYNLNSSPRPTSTPASTIDAATALLGNVASDLSADVLSGAKRLFNATFNR